MIGQIKMKKRESVMNKKDGLQATLSLTNKSNSKKSTFNAFKPQSPKERESLLLPEK